ncbi:MAG: amidohydrolase family protein [Planctomycetes bacterium]|nr:amidohydrolase family protein [Planctomycetota bacterium]
MIIDCHSHIWPSRADLGHAVQFSCLAQPNCDTAQPNQHFDGIEPAVTSIVLGFVSEHLKAKISNHFISKYVNAHPQQLIGFAGIDPTDKNCCEQLRQCHNEDNFAGITLSPACQGFHPCDTRVMQLCEIALELSMPVYFLQGIALPRLAYLEYAQPLFLDEIARRFSELKIIISHLGFPWVEQTISLLAKHPNIYADVAGLARSPWLAYRSLILAYECGVIEKLLFASDFPSLTVKTTIESLYNLNKITLDSLLPAVPREHLKGIVERDSLSLLNLNPPDQQQPDETSDEISTPQA